MEVLAFAGSAEAVIAAVQSGADSVYIRFGGRGVHGFTEDALAKSVRYCRVRGCRVYAELDTLVSDGEAAAAAAFARRVSDLGADAIIAQDLGFISVARAAAPEVPVFAGERLGLHNAAGLEAVRQLGVSRVFLPRELTLGEISSLAARGICSLAVCVQGSACPARAGQCWLGAVMGKGSANRGVCERPCSSRWSLGGRMDDYPLATKDLRLLSRLPELEAAGVGCAVIGPGTGRPERLAAAVRIASLCSREGRAPTEKELDELDTVVARREFTDAYLDGDVKSTAGGFTEPERDDMRAAERAMSAERRRYGNIELRRVKVDFFFAAKSGRPLLAGIQDEDGRRAECKGPVAAPDTPGVRLTAEAVNSELRRTKGTPYHCGRVMTLVPGSLRVPPDTVQRMRAKLIHDLTALRAQPPKRATGPLPAPAGGGDMPEKLLYCVEALSAKQLSPELAELGPDWLYLPLTEMNEAADMVELFIKKGVRVAAVLPRVIQDAELGELAGHLQRARSLGVTEALIGNIGHVALARMAGMEARGDYGLNVFNSWAVEAAARAGLLSVTASFELSLAQIKELSRASELELIGYGRLPVMLTERCIIEASARRCVCRSGANLSDSFGRVMPVLREYVCRNAVYGPEKVFMADRAAELLAAGVSRFRLLFTNEGARECVEVTKACMGRGSYRPNGLTRGFYVKGVE